MNQKILPGKGLADLPFGATRDEVLKVLGEPDEKDSVDLGDEESIAWHYWDLGISLNFDESASYALCTIEVASPEVTLFGQKLIGKTKDEAISFLDLQKIGKHVPETSRGIAYPDVELTLWFNGGEVAEIQWSVMD
ncbi:hypothetical protein [Rubritalea marina]|uniref:hypothetical protein n=1 Tax=Rubritalea marina TaxID=361055 RepID=UPI00037C87F9|nr:hypothetical protein [Rubritalea marina]